MERGTCMKKSVVGALILLALSAAAIAGTASASSQSAKLTKVTLQLKWVPQAQFAGYYAASLKGFYKAQGLDVTLKNGGPNIVPETVVASGQAQFGVDWLPSLLAARDSNTPLVNATGVVLALLHSTAASRLAIFVAGSRGVRRGCS